MRCIAPALALLLATACTLPASAAVLDAPSADLQAFRATAARTGSAPVLALLEAADEQLRAGQPRQAATLLERALRIEPRNPAVWHYLGLARLELGDHAQAEAMAAKSLNLAGGDRTLRTRNAGLMAAAQQAAGKPVVVPSIEPPTLPSQARDWFDARVEPARASTDTRARYERAPREAAEPRGECHIWFSDRRAVVRCDEAEASPSVSQRTRSIVVSSRSAERAPRADRRYRSAARTARPL